MEASAQLHAAAALFPEGKSDLQYLDIMNYYFYFSISICIVVISI
jgi:hypothetical protein